MNLRLVAKLLGIVCLLIGMSMIFSMPFAYPSLGTRGEKFGSHIHVTGEFERDGFYALLWSMVVSFAIGGALWFWGRKSPGRLFRKEAMAVVGLTWFLATFLGALPFWFASTQMGPSIRIDRDEAWGVRNGLLGVQNWQRLGELTQDQAAVLNAVLSTGSRGLSREQLDEVDPIGTALFEQLAEQEPWTRYLSIPGGAGPIDRMDNYRIHHVSMSLVDAMFESQSGFSTTGSTVMSDLEDPVVVPHCILLWRSITHFLGGLGIIVLLVVLLGQGNVGKALMLTEVPGPTQDSPAARMQHTAWQFAGMYAALNVILLLILRAFGMTWFDAICHAFGTMATGGFSTYNGSVGHFGSAGIDFVIILFMVLAGTNFTLLFLFVCGIPGKLIRDNEWQVYVGIIAFATLAVMFFGNLSGDFAAEGDSLGKMWFKSLQYGLFQVVAIITTTGFGTHDFDAWNHFGRGLLLVLMFCGGCAGSTGGGLKVIRHILLVKILRLEIENSFHPNVVRPLRLGGEAVNQELRHSILVFFCFILVIYIGAWLLMVATEPDGVWHHQTNNKLIDSSSAVISTLNNIGPGLGTVGATQNFGHFSWHSKLLFIVLMMIGRVEVYVILCLFTVRFWRKS